MIIGLLRCALFSLFEIQLIYTVVFQVYSKMIQLYVCVYMCVSLFRFFPIIMLNYNYKGYYKILSIVPCAVQYVLLATGVSIVIPNF